MSTTNAPVNSPSSVVDMDAQADAEAEKKFARATLNHAANVSMSTDALSKWIIVKDTNVF